MKMFYTNLTRRAGTYVGIFSAPIPITYYKCAYAVRTYKIYLGGFLAQKAFQMRQVTGNEVNSLVNVHS